MIRSRGHIHTEGQQNKINQFIWIGKIKKGRRERTVKKNKFWWPARVRSLLLRIIGVSLYLVLTGSFRLALSHGSEKVKDVSNMKNFFFFGFSIGSMSSSWLVRPLVGLLVKHKNCYSSAHVTMSHMIAACYAGSNSTRVEHNYPRKLKNKVPKSRVILRVLAR